MAKGGTDSRPVTAQRGHFDNAGPLSAPNTQVSAFVGIGVHYRRYPQAAAMVGAMLWATKAEATGSQIGFMAIGVGFLVGTGVRVFGNGVDRIFGVTGAVLALLGCIVGKALTIGHFVAQAEGMSYEETLSRLNWSTFPELMIAKSGLLDLLFFGIAIYLGYKLSFRRIKRDELEHAMKSPSAEPTQI